MRLLIVVCLVVALVTGDRVRYDGYEVLSITPINEDQVGILTTLESAEDLNLELWNAPMPNSVLDMHVGPESQGIVKTILRDAGIHYNVSINNLQKLIDIEEMENTLLKVQAENEAMEEVPSVLGRYARTSELNAWIDSLASQYPGLCKTESIGKSYQGRDVRLLTVSSGGSKPAIFVDATMHAREWITGGVITHLINQLLTTNEGRALRERYDWYFVPVVNPDGYEYTFTSNRMWRKTRKPTYNPRCAGTDLNRNFDYNWQLGSTDACSQTYRGSSAFSEIENRNLRDAIMARASRLVAYFNIHSFGQFFIPPFLSSSIRPPDYAELVRVLQVAARAIAATHGRTYRVTAPSGRGSGIAIDWAKGKANIKYSYIFELRPASASGGGFIIPPSNIVPNGQEIWNGIVAMATEMKTP